MKIDEEAKQRRLSREARENYLGTLGDLRGINVAKVEVSWFWEEGSQDIEEQLVGTTYTYEEAGYYLVHATGEEPECEGEEGTIYAVFEKLVHEAMGKKQDKNLIDGWHIDDISST